MYEFCIAEEDNTIKMFGDTINVEIGENKVYDFLMYSFFMQLIRSLFFESYFDIDYEERMKLILFFGKYIKGRVSEEESSNNITIFDINSVCTELRLKHFTKIFNSKTIDKIINYGYDHNICVAEIREDWTNFVNKMSSEYLHKKYDKYKLDNESYKQFIDRYKNKELFNMYYLLITNNNILIV